MAIKIVNESIDGTPYADIVSLLSPFSLSISVCNRSQIASPISRTIQKLVPGSLRKKFFPASATADS
jgi:hypothetical protein